MDSTPTHSSLFRLPGFWRLLAVTACSTLASRSLAMVVGYQVFQLTHNPLSLGMLGLVEAIPALSLALYGGHIADRHDRRSILRVTLVMLALCAGLVAVMTSISGQLVSVATLYTAVFVVGIARGFAEPATAALESQIVPPHLLVKGSPWFASTWLTASIVGPVLGGIGLSLVGPAGTWAGFAVFYAAAWIAADSLAPRPVPPPPKDESIWLSIAEGVKYVTSNQVLLWSMALDLFAVLFGGAIALLPIFAGEDMLNVGEIGLGFLNASPYVGALLTMLLAMWRPPMRRAGLWLLFSVAGFGVAMIVFALSKNFYLSLAALFFSGVFDGVSVVIRRSIVRLMSPIHLRGRIAAVSMVFIGSSNELGALESGFAAFWLGTVRSVWLGGLVTLLVVGTTSVAAPKLRNLQLTGVREEDS